MTTTSSPPSTMCRAIPTMLLFKGGKVAETFVGMMQKGCAQGEAPGQALEQSLVRGRIPAECFFGLAIRTSERGRAPVRAWSA
jgi:hypothetical protein